MKLRQLFESPTTAVIAFGRMNPPTIGHQKLVQAIKSHNGDHYVFLSQSQKPKTDPLAFTDKLRYAKFFFPEVTIGHPQVKTIIQALQKINELGYEDLIYVAGSDRVQAFEELINKYNGKDYNFKNIQVVSAGERDPDAEGAEGMSASKMRQAAADGNLEAFTEGTPRPELAEEMFAAVRQGMGIRDEELAESIQEAEGPKVPQKITPIKMSSPPKAPDATIPRTRDGYTTDDGITYRQDKYDENIMHVETGSGDYTFDGARLIKWVTPRFKGVRQIHNFVQSTIKVDADIEIKTKDGPVMFSTDAVYDLEGNLKNAGKLSTSTAGLGFAFGNDEFNMDYVISDKLSIHVTGHPRKGKVSPEQVKTINNFIPKSEKDGLKQLINFANKVKEMGAKVTFKSPANQGAIPFNQGIKMLTQATTDESIGSDINFPGFDSEEEKKKKKKKKQSLLDKLKAAMGVSEDVSPEDEDKFHNELDDLVHKYFGDSPDEEKMLKKYKKANESDVVIDKARLRDYLRMLIDDAIDKEEDINKLSKVLKMLVGKEIRTRGDHKFTITSEDVVEACKNRRMNKRGRT